MQWLKTSRNRTFYRRWYTIYRLSLYIYKRLQWIPFFTVSHQTASSLWNTSPRLGWYSYWFYLYMPGSLLNSSWPVLWYILDGHLSIETTLSSLYRVTTNGILQINYSLESVISISDPFSAADRTKPPLCKPDADNCSSQYLRGPYRKHAPSRASLFLLWLPLTLSSFHISWSSMAVWATHSLWAMVDVVTFVCGL